MNLLRELKLNVLLIVPLVLAGLCIPACAVQAENPALALLNGASQSKHQEHIVQKGQLAVQIAQEYDLSLDELRSLNPGRDIARLQIGDKLIVDYVQEEEVAPPDDRPDKIALLAAAEERREQPQRKEEPALIVSVLSMMIKLAVVLGLAYLTVLALKWFSAKRDAVPRSQRELQIGDTVRLSSTNSLHMVSVKGKTLLVGCSSGQVTLLREFDDERLEEEPSEAPSGRFAEYLEKYSSASAQSGAAGRVAGLLRDCAMQLKKMRGNSQIAARRNTRLKGKNGK